MADLKVSEISCFNSSKPWPVVEETASFGEFSSVVPRVMISISSSTSGILAGGTKSALVMTKIAILTPSR